MKPEFLKMETESGSKINLDALYKIVPSCFTETRDEKTGELRHTVDFDVLRRLLGDDAVEDAPEEYRFDWVGKQNARNEAAKPINKTLRPVPESSLNWDTTQNLYIEGDNLDALKLLQKSYMGKVKMIYIDPPYNTGNDFVYNDDFAVSKEADDEAAGNVDELGLHYRRNLDSNGRFHSDWCSMIYPRLMLAKTLLTEDGVIFISIDDNEVENLKKICNEVFGGVNFLYELSVVNNLNGNDNSSGMMETQEYALLYSKNKDKCVIGVLPLSEDDNSDWEKDDLGYWKEGRCLKATGINAPREARPNLFFPIFINETTLEFTTDEEVGDGWYHLIPLTEGKEMSWYWSQNTFEQNHNEVIVKKTSDGYSLYKKQRPSLGDMPSKRGKTTFYSPKYANANSNAEVKSLFEGKKIFDYTKSSVLIRDFISLGNTQDNDVVLDFFSGSATTAHAVMQLNAEDGGKRKFILVQLPEKTAEVSEAYKAGYKNICEIGEERIRRAGRKIKNEAGLPAQDLDTGFRVFRIDESNMNDVYFAPKDYSQDELDLKLDNVKPGRTELDLLYGCMLNYGVPLSLPTKSETVDGCTIYTVNDGDLVACFAKDITENVVKEMAAKAPLRIIFRDSCFSQDDGKINIYESFKQLLDWSDDEAYKNIKVI